MLIVKKEAIKGVVHRRGKVGSFLLVCVLFLAAANLRPAITSVSPLLETIRDALGMNRSMISFLTAIPVLCMGIFAPLAAKLGVHWGIERSIVACLALIGAATAVRAIAVSSFLLMTTTVLIGIGIAVAGPLLSGFIKRYFPDKSTSMIGVFSIGVGFGASIAAGLTVPLQGILNGSWVISLASWSLLAVLALLLWWPIMVRASELPDAELSANHKMGLLPWRSKRAWLLVIIFGTQSGLYYAITTWLAPIAQDMGLNETQAGIIVMVFSSLTMVCGLVIPILLNRSGSNNRRPWMAGCGLFLLAGLLLIVFFKTANPWLCAILLGIGSGGMFPLVMILPLDETTTPYEANAWTAMMQCGGYIISAFVPVLTGWLRDFSGNYEFPLIGLIVICLVMMWSIAMVSPRKSERVKQS
jgi:CP family cyanate transporter-like MFS transporter